MSLNRMFRPEPRRVDAEQARTLVEEGAFLLDVRTSERFAAADLPEAVNIPLTQLRRRIDEVPTDRPIVVCCRTGRKTRVASRILLERDLFTDIYNLGGISSWE